MALGESATGILDWQEALAAADFFVASHPTIEVSPSGVGVPREYRETFYQNLLSARRALTAAVVKNTEFAEKSLESLQAVRARLIQQLELDDYILPTALQAFIDDLYGGGSQSFLDKMLLYIQRSIDASELYEQAAIVLPQSFSRLALVAYEAQLAYSAVLLLEPTAAYLAEPRDDLRALLLPARSLELGHQTYSATLRLPEAVFDTGVGKIGFKFELVNEIDFYHSKPTRRRDFSSGGDTRGIIGRRFALFYRFGEVETVPYLADRDKALMLRPDIVLGVLGERDLEIESYCQMTLKRVEVLAAQKATVFDILEGAASAARALQERSGAPRFEIVETGFDSTKLEPFTDALTMTV
jgi:hypothetical protein